ncbi:chromosome condensation protein CrcB [Bacillus sp. SA1-12]|uniref:fluoride efflux transporter CrcB n=1 Tax=Bacillus sp. SA1-12 TaxID=1455638 RepID=UPI00062596A2|nr:fluoride efflux transporter CrcB [Bacillus sp. SA1-12]KKI91698.1 chromosome condensation protein CrcB [Bacillus sp. SA1-12]
MVYLLVGLAGLLGAILRYLIGLALFDESLMFPFSTLVTNLIGSFLLTWFTTGLLNKFSMPAHIKTVIGTGFVGSFTTFSTLSVETVHLFQSGNLFLGIIYILISMFGGLVMSRLGFSVRKEEEIG